MTAILSVRLSSTFNAFFSSSKSGGIVLILCTLLSLLLANSSFGPAWLGFWQQTVAGLSIEHWVNDALMALFALANTGIVVGARWAGELLSSNSLGIMLGLVAGKPLGIVLFSFAAVALGLCRLPLDLAWRHVIGAGLLGGIGFTMSIFITNLAFAGAPDAVNASKMAILLASLTAGIAGFAWLKLRGAPTPIDRDTDTLDFDAARG